MPFDLAAHINAMTRTVNNLERDGKPAKAVVAIPRLRHRRRRPLGRDDQSRAPAGAGLRRSPATSSSAAATRSRATPAAPSPSAMPPERIAATWEFGGGVSWVNVTPARRRATAPASKLEHIAARRSALGPVRPGRRRCRLGPRLHGPRRHLAEPAADVAARSRRGLDGLRRGQGLHPQRQRWLGRGRHRRRRRPRAAALARPSARASSTPAKPPRRCDARLRRPRRSRPPPHPRAAGRRASTPRAKSSTSSPASSASPRPRSPSI